MTHGQRLEWLEDHGFLPELRSVNLPQIGDCIWVDGNKGKRQVSLWLSVRDGIGRIHGVNDKDLLWEELQTWIDPPPEPEVVTRPLMGQRSLFGDVK
jgi:hypothetical protein